QASSNMDDITIDVTPARPGANHIDLYASRLSGGLPDKDLRDVRVIATPPGGAPPVTLAARFVTPRHFIVAAAPLTTPGTWTLDLTGRSEQMPGMPAEPVVMNVPIT